MLIVQKAFGFSYMNERVHLVEIHRIKIEINVQKLQNQRKIHMICNDQYTIIMSHLG